MMVSDSKPGQFARKAIDQPNTKRTGQRDAAPAPVAPRDGKMVVGLQLADIQKMNSTIVEL